MGIGGGGESKLKIECRVKGFEITKKKGEGGESLKENEIKDLNIDRILVFWVGTITLITIILLEI